MEYTRLLRQGTKGEDVKAVKDKLLGLGYLHASTHDTFGSDTRRAVKAYQADHGLDADGVIGPLTWAALLGGAEGAPPGEAVNEEVEPPVEAFDGDLPGTLGDAAAQAIMADLGGVSAIRKEIVLDALQYAADPADHDEFPLSLYIRGGNLYNKDLSPNVITAARIRSGAARQPEYYDGGRMEMMLQTVAAYPGTTGADCSGGIVGLMRKHGMYAANFDANANCLGSNSHSRAINKADLRPGDWLHRSGHIGMYVGGGYAVEWVGGAYGCQLTKVAKRRVYNYVDHKMHTMSAWTGYRRPIKY